jgi:hypothetical protein
LGSAPCDDEPVLVVGDAVDELFGEAEADAFRAKAARIAESLKLALFYRPDRPWPMVTP